MEKIWESVVEDAAQFELTGAQKAELDRRLALRERSNRGADWTEVKGRILGES